MDKTVVGVTTLEGNDVLIYSDGSMSMVVAVTGAKGNYVLTIPMDMQTALKAEDVGNIEFSTLPGYVAPGQNATLSAPGPVNTPAQPNTAAPVVEGLEQA